MERALCDPGDPDARIRGGARDHCGLAYWQHPWGPEATGAVVLKLVDAKSPPLRVFFGTPDCP